MDLRDGVCQDHEVEGVRIMLAAAHGSNICQPLDSDVMTDEVRSLQVALTTGIVSLPRSSLHTLTLHTHCTDNIYTTSSNGNMLFHTQSPTDPLDYVQRKGKASLLALLPYFSTPTTGYTRVRWRDVSINSVHAFCLQGIEMSSDFYPRCWKNFLSNKSTMTQWSATAHHQTLHRHVTLRSS